MEGKEHNLVTATTYKGLTFIDNNYTVSTSLCLDICRSLLPHQITCYTLVAGPDLELSKGEGEDFVLLALPAFPPSKISSFYGTAYDLFSISD